MSDTPALTGRYNMLPMESVIFGPGTVSQVKTEAERLGMKRIFLIISPSLARTTDVQQRLEADLGDKLAMVYSGSQPHVPDTVVLDAAAQARATGVDGILAVGGGSPVDIAKAVNLCLADGVETREQLLEHAVKFTYPDQMFVPEITGQTLPQISVATTLSAGEFSHITGITDTVDLVKNMYIDTKMTAKVVIHDSELCASTPRRLWAGTGMRAVDHCIEGLCSTTAQPMVSALCADALRRLVRYLPISAKDPNDLHAASQCLTAAWQSLQGLSNVTMGLSHGCGHQLGARNGVPHGETSCVMLPTVLDYNYEYTKDQQQLVAEIMADEMGVPVPTDGASDIVRQFIESLDLPTRLSEVGVTREDFPFIARDAMNDMIVATNPRPVAGEPDVLKILEQAY